MKTGHKKIIFLLLVLTFLLFGKNSLADYNYEGVKFYAPNASAAASSYAAEGIAFYAYTTQTDTAVPVYRYFDSSSGDHFYSTSSATPPGYASEGVAFYAYPTQAAGTLPVYRFFNSTNGKHFYTSFEDEKNALENNPQWGYHFEDIEFYAFPTQAANTSPVYRFFNPANGDHLYTASEAEKDSLTMAPVYRFFNPASNDHFYTASNSEKSLVANTSQSGYYFEGIAFYGYTSQVSGTAPVYRYFNQTSGDHFYSTNSATPPGYTSEGVAFYDYTSQSSNTLPVYRFFNPASGKHFYTASESEKSYLMLSPLGPDISVGLWYNSKSDTFQISGNKNYVIKDPNGNILATVSGGTTTSVTYDSSCNLKISGATASSFDVNTSVTFAPADGDDSTMIFDTNHPNSSLDHYRGEIKVQYYHGPDIYGGNTGNTVAQVWIINTLPLEQYVWGDGEMTGTGPIEHTKVMATIFRTYGYWYIKYATKYAPYGFQIRSDSGSQVYSGYDWENQYPNIKTAAQDTQGQIVSYDGDVALTPYSSWSDGNTRSAKDVWGTDAYPWCQAVSDPYGKNSSMTTAQLEAAGNHMVGLIAHGSLTLASDPYDWSWDKILKYYYTGISLASFY